MNQLPPESPVGGADLSSPARPREVSYHPTTAAHRSQTKTSPQSHSKSPETRSSNNNASGDQSPNTRINAHDSGPPHPHLAMAVGVSTGGGGAAMGRRVHRAAATSRCNGSPPSPPRQSDFSVYCARCDGESESILLHTPRLLLRPRLRRICSPRDEEGWVVGQKREEMGRGGGHERGRRLGRIRPRE